MSDPHHQPMFPPPSNVIPPKIPPEKTLCVGQPMEVPYLGTTDPLTYILEVRIDIWVELTSGPLELIVTLLIPNNINRFY